MFIIPTMAVLARLCGASWSPKWLPSELLWALVIAAATTTTPHIFVIVAVWSYAAMQLGHGRFYKMTGANLADPEPEEIERYIQKFYKGDITKPIYSWVCMGAKGLIIGLPIGLAPAVVNALLWPAAYFIGMRVLKNGAYAEVIAGAVVGALLWGVA